MILDRSTLSTISSKWSAGMFESPWANLIGQWCVDYVRQYEAPPGALIQSIFTAWADKGGKDEATVDMISRFLDGLSREHGEDEINSEYVVDLASRHFNKVKIRSLIDLARDDLDAGDVDAAANEIMGFGRVELGAGACVDIFQDKAAIQTAFEESSEGIVKYDGPLGEFLNPMLIRDALVSFLAPPKAGKTFLLLDLAFRAAIQRKRVAFFEVGDMSQNQIIKRFMARIARHPILPQLARRPTSMKRDEDGLMTVKHAEKYFDTGLNWKSAWEAAQAVQTKQIRSAASYLKLCVEPNSSITVKGIETTLKNWERDGWVPDVVVIDYADILAPPPGVRDGREQIIMTWRHLRALSQTLHCLVVTATQSDAEGMNTGTLGMRNFSGSMLKLAEASGVIGINQTPREKEMDLIRLNSIVARENENTPSRCVHVAGCRPIADLCLLSSW